MALHKSAVPTLAESVAEGTVIEEHTLRLYTTVTRDGNEGGASIKTGDRVRRRLAVCIFLHTAGVAIADQVVARVRRRMRVCLSLK